MLSIIKEICEPASITHGIVPHADPRFAGMAWSADQGHLE